MAIKFSVISSSNSRIGHKARALSNDKKFFLNGSIFKNFLLLFCMYAFLLVAFSVHANAATVTLSWERNQEPDIAGYKIFYGTASRSYTNIITINDTAHEPLTRTYSVTGLDEGRTYYFAIKAFDLAGQESEFSDEVSVEIPNTVVNSTNGTDDTKETDGNIDNLPENWYVDESWIEVGTVTINHEWKTINLTKTFQNPIVIVGPPTFNGQQPCVIRLRNVESNSFEMRIQEWMYLDGIHLQEDVSYMVLEAGEHFLPDGTMWQVGTFSLSGTLKWKNVVFPTPFSNNPLVFLAIQTFNGPQAVTTRVKQISGDDFFVALEEEERLNDGHVPEIVGYLAVEPGSSNGIWLGTIDCNHEFVTVTSVDKQVKLEEEKSKDRETTHLIEQVGILDIGDNVFAQIQSFNGGDTVSLRIREIQ